MDIRLAVLLLVLMGVGIGLLMPKRIKIGILLVCLGSLPLVMAAYSVLSHKIPQKKKKHEAKQKEC